MARTRATRAYVTARRGQILDRHVSNNRDSLNLTRQTGQTRLIQPEIQTGYVGRQPKVRAAWSQGRPEMRVSPFYSNLTTTDRRWDK